MDLLSTILLLLSGVSIGLAAFLYNDGLDHELAGLMSGGFGILATGVSSWSQGRQNQEQSYNCAVYGEGCQHPPDAFEAWLGGLFSGILVEVLVLGFCGLVGLALARATRRQPTDGRKSAVLPPD